MWRNTVARTRALSKHHSSSGSKYFAGSAMTSWYAKGETSRSRPDCFAAAVPGSQDGRHLPVKTIITTCFVLGNDQPGRQTQQHSHVILDQALWFNALSSTTLSLEQLRVLEP